jgi:hypothetical protein
VATKDRPDVPDAWVGRIDGVLRGLPQVRCESAWVGTRWRVQGATIAHVFGGEDGAFRITFRGEHDEVMAFQHLGSPYFKAGWGANVIGLLVDDATDWAELAELLTDSYCLVAPGRLAAAVERP